MRIAVDVDGVLADHLTPFVTDLEAETGFELRPEELDTWDLPLPGGETDLLTAVTRRLADPSYIRRAPVVDGAVEGVERLRERDHEVVVTTHRPAHTHSVTREWLADNDIPYDEYLDDVPENKGEVGADLLVDDYHGNVRDAIDAGWAGLLFRQPWNRLYAAEFDHRQIVDSWEQVPDAVWAALDAASE